MPALAPLLPKTMAEWRRLLTAAVELPIGEVWFPEHFYLHSIRGSIRYSPQKSSIPQLNSQRASAVLVLLSPPSHSSASEEGEEEVEELCITLTKRTTTVGSHKGQMSFPGGRIDDGEDVIAAAQREAMEEVGLLPDEYDVLGRLTTIATNAAGSAATPILALAPNPVTPTCASPNEVASLHYLHLRRLLLHSQDTHCGVIKHRSLTGSMPSQFPCFFASNSQHTAAGSLVASPSAVAEPQDMHLHPMLPEDFPGELVWGLTGFMLCELLARIAVVLERQHPGEAAAMARHMLVRSSIIARDPDHPLGMNA